LKCWYKAQQINNHKFADDIHSMVKNQNKLGENLAITNEAGEVATSKTKDEHEQTTNDGK